MAVLCIVFCYFANDKLPFCLCKPEALVVQNASSFTSTVSSMVAYNVVVSVGVTIEDKTKFAAVVYLQELIISDI